MPDTKEKENRLKNTFRDKKTDEEDLLVEEPVLKEKKEPRKRKPSKKQGPGFFSSLKEFFQNEKLHRIFGLFLFLASLYLAVAFVSFFFTWQEDQDKVTGSIGDLFFSDETVSNWLGKLGALVSHLFIHKGFGIAALFFPFLFFLTGFRILFGKALLPMEKTYAHSLFLLGFTSLVMGFVFQTRWFALGGTFGFEISRWLTGSLGFIGTGGLIGFLFLSYLVIGFNFAFNLFPEKPAEAEEGGPIKNELRGNPEPLVEVNLGNQEEEKEAEEQGTEISLGEEESEPEEKPDEKAPLLSEINLGESEVTMTIEQQNEFRDMTDEDY
jgi:DNA segregation ATPase FtsK/SpoIIIE, S-DNA-T family